MGERVLVLGVLGRGVVDASVPLLRGDDLGVVRGDGCFETLRVIDGVPQQLDAHLMRLAYSASRLALPPPDVDAWRALIAEVLAAWARRGEAVLRLVLTRGPEDGGPPTSYAMLAPLPADLERQRRDGVRVITLTRGLDTSEHCRAPWLLVGVKSTSYAINMAAQRHARSVGADDVIFVSSDGLVLEGPTATVVWATGDVLCTTPNSFGILAGTTVQVLFERAGDFDFTTDVRGTTVEELRGSDDIWLVSSVRGAVRVVELDGQARPDSGLSRWVQAATVQPQG